MSTVQSDSLQESLHRLPPEWAAHETRIMQGGQPLAVMVRDFVARLVLRLPMTTGCAFAAACTAICFDAAPLATAFCTCVKAEHTSDREMRPRLVHAARTGQAEPHMHAERDQQAAVA